MYAYISGVSGLGLLMVRFHQFLTVICHIYVFSFLYDNLCKYQSIFTKLGMCINIVELWFGVANGQISSIFDRVICLPHSSGGVLLFHVFF